MPFGLSYRNETRNDRWIVEHVFPGKREGFFLEAGAADGGGGSSCYVLEKELGWSGICVEPNEAFFSKLVENRPNSVCENPCLSDRSGSVTYIEGHGRSDLPYLGGIKKNLERFKYGSEEVLAKGREIEEEAVTLEALLDKHSAPTRIDYAAFDIEGSELEVLEKFCFSRYQFSALSLECDGTIWRGITTLLTSNGYREVGNPFNTRMPWERYWLHRSIG